jgi:SSS family solute:Na+ symporter
MDFSGQGGLTLIDWLIVVVYASSTIGLGYYFSRRQRSTSEYFVGSGAMNPFLVGISLFATLLSTISYLSMPGETIAKGPVATVANLCAYPIAFLVVSKLFLDIYMRQRVTSAYELLEERLGLGMRLLGSVLFIAMRLVWMSLLVYIAAKAMTVMLGVGDEWIPLVVLVTGFVSVIYTSLGGLGAVVITDFLQFTLLFGGAWLVIGLVTYELGGFSWFPTSWQPTWDAQPVFSFDPRMRVTVLGTILSASLWQICTAGGDQVSVQRFMATRDAKAAKKAYLTQMCAGACVATTLVLVGFALLGYFQQRPDELPAGLSLITDGDRIFPRFVSFHLPPGVTGLVVSAMFAAAMSSIDSGVNSITAVIMTDFLDRFGLKPKSEKGHVRWAQILALTVGAIVVVGSTFIGHVPGNFTAMTQRTTNLLVTPIFGLFFFAMFVPFARAAGVLVGTIYGVTTAFLVAFSGSFYEVLAAGTGLDTTAISFQWISPVALGANLTAGLVACRIMNPEDSRQQILLKMAICLVPLLALVGLILGYPWIDQAPAP